MRYYRTIKFDIKILLNIHNLQFCGALCAQSDKTEPLWHGKYKTCTIRYSVKAAMFFGSPEHLTFLRYEVLSPQRRYVMQEGVYKALSDTCEPLTLT